MEPKWSKDIDNLVNTKPVKYLSVHINFDEEKGLSLLLRRNYNFIVGDRSTWNQQPFLNVKAVSFPDNISMIAAAWIKW